MFITKNTFSEIQYSVGNSKMASLAKLEVCYIGEVAFESRHATGHYSSRYMHYQLQIM